MASQAQINANRQNAQKSTGPRTNDGKAASCQNAVKHGLFAREAVIHGEDPAEFDLYRQAFLADLRPVGPMESMLAERIVSLAWRLLRAERIQNDAINEQILKASKPSGSGVSRVTKSLIPKSVRRTLGGLGEADHEPTVGRFLAEHELDAWLLDRLQLYERRIETSMFRTIEQLRQFQRRREAEQAPAEARDWGDENPQAQSHGGNPLGGKLKKRTQFPAHQTSITACPEKSCDDGASPVAAANKANRAFPEPVWRDRDSL